MANAPRLTLTLSRTLGAGGAELGLRVARDLDLPFLDQAILQQAAMDLDRDPEPLERLEEHRPGLLEQAFGMMAYGAGEAPFVPPLELPLHSRDLFEAESRILQRIHATTGGVVLGRGGFMALRGLPRTLHVFLHASREVRIRRVLDRGKADGPEAARKLIEASDAGRGAFVREISGRDWGRACGFDLCLDTGRLGLDACVRTVLDLARTLEA